MIKQKQFAYYENVKAYHKNHPWCLVADLKCNQTLKEWLEENRPVIAIEEVVEQNRKRNKPNENHYKLKEINMSGKTITTYVVEF